MKKLLFSLGAITTIVAPVAIVVSCGSSKHDSTQIFKTSGELNKYITVTANWNSLGNKVDEVFNKLKDSDSHVVVSSLQNDSEKNSNAKAILVKGTPSEMPAGKTWGNSNYFQWSGEYKEADQSDSKSSKDRWGIEEEKLSNISYVVFLFKLNGKDIVEIAKVFKGQNNTYGILETSDERLALK